MQAIAYLFKKKKSSNPSKIFIFFVNFKLHRAQNVYVAGAEVTPWCDYKKVQREKYAFDYDV